MGGGSDDVATAATDLVNRLSDIPFESIGKSLDQTLAGVSALVNDKQLGEAVASLRSTLTSTQTLVDNLNHDSPRRCSVCRPSLPGSRIP